MTQETLPEQAKMVAKTEVIPSNTFGFLPGQRGSTPTTYGSHKACELALRDAMDTLGVSKYAMAKLLGITPSNYNHWFNGIRRPSQVYLLRVIKLQAMANSGTNFRLISSINWDTGQIHYKKGVEFADGRHKVPDGGESLSEKESANATGLAAFPHKRGGRSDPQS